MPSQITTSDPSVQPESIAIDEPARCPKEWEFSTAALEVFRCELNVHHVGAHRVTIDGRALDWAE